MFIYKRKLLSETPLYVRDGVKGVIYIVEVHNNSYVRGQFHKEIKSLVTSTSQFPYFYSVKLKVQEKKLSSFTMKWTPEL